MLKSISLRLCTLIVLLFVGILSFAQQVQVKGTVVEKSSGESIIGASVMEVGSNSNGTITDIDGNFTLSVASGATLSVSYIGYKTVTVKAQPTLRIELTEDSQLIDEVVVTALGIKRNDRSLGYSTETIKSSEITKTQNNNWAQSLEGKVAGLKIQTAGAGPLGTAVIKLRGDVSMDMGKNGALIVVDGIPMSDKTTGTGNSAYGAGAGGDH